MHHGYRVPVGDAGAPNGSQGVTDRAMDADEPLGGETRWSLLTYVATTSLVKSAIPVAGRASRRGRKRWRMGADILGVRHETCL